MACTNPVRLQKDFSISSLKATEPPGGGGGALKKKLLSPKVQDSTFQWQKFPGFRNLNFLTRGDSWIFNINVKWCEVQCICTYFSWQVLIKTFLLHCPQQVQLFSLDARKTEQKSKLLDRLGLRRGEIKSDKRRRWNFSGIRTHMIDVVYKNSKWVKEAMTSWPWKQIRAKQL